MLFLSTRIFRITWSKGPTDEPESFHSPVHRHYHSLFPRGILPSSHLRQLRHGDGDESRDGLRPLQPGSLRQRRRRRLRRTHRHL